MKFRCKARTAVRGAMLLFFAASSLISNTAVAQATSQKAAGKLSVLLVGNSHLLMPGFDKRLKRELRSNFSDLKFQIVAKIGTTLTKSRKKKQTLQAIKSVAWDVIVLQESTTAFMTKHGRRNFMNAVAWYDEQKPAGARLLLWQPWPQGARHALYARRGVWGKWFKNPPRNPDQLFSWISAGVKRGAEQHDVVIAPIGHCWMSLAKRKRPYAGDDYHPSGRGLTFIAKTLAGSVVATASGGTGNEARHIGACP